MPCPYFEPQTILRNGRSPGTRLPLLDEYEGRCHATCNPFPAPSDLQFRCCNHGYSLGTCPYFPPVETRSCIRFDVLRCTEEFLELVHVSERDHAPLAWQTLRFARSTEQLEPELTDSAARAQAISFCRSYLRLFSR